MTESLEIGRVLRLCTVKVTSRIGSGSGVLCKLGPGDTSLFILTARHLIANEDEVVSPEEVSLDFHSSYVPGKYSLHANDQVLTFEESQKDIAVLVVPLAAVEAITGELPIIHLVKESFGLKKCLFRGFPEAVKGNEPIRMDGEITEIVRQFEFQFEFEVPNSLADNWISREERTSYENVMGFSGSGVFLLNDDEIYLLGVVSKFGPFNRFWGIKTALVEDLFLQNELPPLVWKMPEVRPEVRLGMKRLAENSHGTVRRQILTKVADRWQVERLPLMEDVFQKIRDNAFVIISGEAGVGKSAFIEEVTRRFLESAGWQVWAFRGEQFCHANVGEVLSRINIQVTATDLISSPLCAENLLIWLDGAEKLVETMKFDAFLDLVRLINHKPKVHIIVTLRKFSVEHFRLRLMDLIRPVLFDLSPLSDEELSDALATFPQIQPLLQNPKLKKLLRLPFYLNFAVQLPTILPEEEQKLNESKLRAKMWTQSIEKGSPIRTRQFEEIVLRRANGFSLFELPETPDYEALRDLEHDHIIVLEESGNKERYAPAHDIFEDWALARHAQRCWEQRQTPESFFTKLGSAYAIRRGFRHWLEENLLNETPQVATFFETVMTSASIDSFWEGEINIVLLQSPHGTKYLQTNHTRLLENKAAGLGRLLRIFRTACKEPLTDSIGVVPSEESWQFYSMNFRPVGIGWETLVKFIWGNLDEIPDKRLVANFLQDWGNQIVGSEALPDAAREAGLTLLKLIEGWKITYGNGKEDGQDKQIKDCVRLLFRLTEVVKDGVRDLLELASQKIIERNKEDWEFNKFYELLLEGVLSYFFSQKVCLHLPDTIIALANTHWKHEYIQKEVFYHHDILDEDRKYGLAKDYWLRYNPESAYQTPIYWLLKFHPHKALPFLVELFNYAAQKYRETEFDNTMLCKEILITLNNGKKLRQWGNHTHFAMYRGQVFAPDLLKSCLMVLEKWLLEMAGRDDEISKENTHFVFDFLLKKSESVAISGVLTSVAMACSETVSDQILPFLRVREFFEWDFQRWTSDINSLAIGGFLEFDKIHQQERIESNKLPHRKTLLIRHISDLSLRNPEIRNQFEAILDSFYQEIDPDDKIWRKWLYEMDLRKWECGQESVSEGKPVLVIQPKFDPEVAEMISRTQTEVQSDAPIANASMWGSKMFEREAVENPTVEKWIECYLILKPLWENPSSLPKHERFIYFFPASLAAVGVRDFLMGLDTEQKSWCEDVLLNRAERSLTRERDRSQIDLGESGSPIDNQPASLSLVELLRPEFRETTRQEAAVLLFECLCCFNPENNLHTSFFAHVGENLWKIAPELGLACWNGVIEFARLQKERYESKVDWYANNNQGKTVQKRSETFDRRESELKEKVLKGGFRVNPAEISFETHTHWQLDIAFLILPDNYQHEDFQVFTRQYLEILAARLPVPGRRGSDSSQYYNVNLHFQSRFAYYLLRQPDVESNAAFQQLLNHAFKFQKSWHRDEGYEFFDRCFKEVLLAADQLQEGAALQRLWKQFYQKLKDTGRHSYLNLLFLDLHMWNQGISHWKPIEGNEVFFRQAILDFGDKEFNSVLRLLSGIGSQTLLPQALEMVSVILPKLQDDNWDGFEAEKLLQRLYYIHYQDIRQNSERFSCFLALLDSMVTRDSSLAFFIRESCFGG